MHAQANPSLLCLLINGIQCEYKTLIRWRNYCIVDGQWFLFVNGRLKINRKEGASKPIPLGGEFVLGQASRETFKFVEKYAFVGDLAHLHIWDFVMTPAEVRYIKGLCKLMYCGNAVQWTEFRKGTRGAMRMRWPSQVLGGNIFLIYRCLNERH